MVMYLLVYVGIYMVCFCCGLCLVFIYCIVMMVLFDWLFCDV